eukprot:489241-Alexandrium_andersonii.AAC.1
MSASLVGSEMCIRDSSSKAGTHVSRQRMSGHRAFALVRFHPATPDASVVAVCVCVRASERVLFCLRARVGGGMSVVV